MTRVRLTAGIETIITVSLLLTSGCAADGITSEVLKGKVETAQKQEAALSAELAETKEHLSAVGAENQRLTEILAADEKQRAQSNEQIAALTGQIQEITRQYEARNQSLLNENQQLTEQLRSSQEELAFQNASLARTPTEVIIPNRGEPPRKIVLDDPAILPPHYEENAVIVELQDRLLFDPASGKLTEQGDERLDSLWERFQEYDPNGRLRVESHTARTAGQPDNSPAGHAEAYEKGKAVFDYFLYQKHVPAYRIALTIRGCSAPLIEESVPNAADRNSRIELIWE